MSYALVDIQTAAVVKLFSGLPNPLVWPNGDASHGVSVGDERCGIRFVQVVPSHDRPGEFYRVGHALPAQLDGNTLVPATSWEPMDLDEVKNILLARVDATAEERRQRLLSEGTGQAMVYMAKWAEAQRFLGGLVTNPESYPLLGASLVGSTTLAETADIVNRKAWQSMGELAAIEKIRISAKDALRSSTAVDQGAALVAGLKWP